MSEAENTLSLSFTTRDEISTQNHNVIGTNNEIKAARAVRTALIFTDNNDQWSHLDPIRARRVHRDPG